MFSTLKQDGAAVQSTMHLLILILIEAIENVISIKEYLYVHYKSNVV